jgi:hypothetical protein
MTKIDVKLSDLPNEEYGGNLGVYHDLRYANDNYGGNQNETLFEITNSSGNTLDIEFGFYEQNVQTDKWEWNWQTLRDVDGIKIKIKGGIENSEFLQMLQLILETEKIVKIIKP